MARPASAGDVVADKYRVERLLGSGGMGYVVAARHMALDQLVAIKFLTGSALGEEEAVARFRREAKAASRLRGDHVAKVFDVGVHTNEEPFIVMEHLDGADLGAIGKDRGILPVPEACEYVLQACEALAEAHALGIIHRDVKLANLFLTRSASGFPLVKVLDFGVSKTLSAFEAQGDVTKTAAMLGSPKYMSPEQMNDPRAVDARTDVWSLGVCLYRLVGGVAPFGGETIGRLCTMVLHEAPAPLHVLRPDLPPTISAVVACCLEKDRAHRFANVAELGAALVPFCADPERAQLSVARAASVLGVPVPPPGYLSPPAPRLPTPADGSPAWSATYGSGKRGVRRTEIVVGAVLALAVLAFLSVVLVARRSTATATAAAVPVPVETTPAAAAPPPTPPPAGSASAEPTATAMATAPVETSRPRKKPRATNHPRRDATNDPLALPGDRK